MHFGGILKDKSFRVLGSWVGFPQVTFGGASYIRKDIWLAEHIPQGLAKKFISLYWLGEHLKRDCVEQT